MRIDESQLITRMSKTNKALQPFTLEPDAEPSMPNFDQWTTPSLTNTTGGQNEPEVVTDELDIDIVPQGSIPKAIKFLGESMCPGPQGGHDHSTSLVGKDENGKWRSVGSDEYTSNLCGRLMMKF